MVTDAIQYGVKSVGHDAPLSERTLVAPQGDLQVVFEEFLNSPPSLQPGVTENLKEKYTLAETGLDNLKRPISVDEAHSLLFLFQNHPDFFGKAGIFISAVYNRVPERVIVLDLELPKVPLDLAYNLSANKVFVNKKRISTSAGYDAKGILINYGAAANIGWNGAPKLLNYGAAETVGGCFNCSFDLSLLINAGTAGPSFGAWVHGIAIDFGKTKSINAGYSTSLVISTGTAAIKYTTSEVLRDGRIICFQEPTIKGPLENIKVLHPKEVNRIVGLRAYVEKIREKIELGRNDVDKAIEAMDSLNADTIKKDLERMITSAGVRW